MNKEQFFDQLTQVAVQYDEDNQWFGFQRGGPVWSQGTWIDFVLAAWELYQNARATQLQMTLLGDTKIRSDPGLLLNFGLVANTTRPQEDKDRLLVSKLMNERRWIARGSSFNTAVEMMGPGSILSARRWSPMLNDSLMLAGISLHQDFHFALNEDERAVWHSLTTIDRSAPGPLYVKPEFAKRIEQFGSVFRPEVKGLDPKETWLQFFRLVPRVFWEKGSPRVFVREVLGLKFFGYKPVFTLQELGFTYSGGGQMPTFQNYLTGLRAVGFGQRERLSIMSSLSEFLFDDVNALQDIGA